jgi:hypothetical protein
VHPAASADGRMNDSWAATARSNAIAASHLFSCQSTANVRRGWPDLPWCQAVVAESASVESPINTFHTNLYTEPTT